MEHKPQRSPERVTSSGSLDRVSPVHTPDPNYHKIKQAQETEKVEAALFKSEESRLKDRYIEVMDMLRNFVGKALDPDQKKVKQTLLSEKKEIEDKLNEKRIFQDPKSIN